MKKGKPKWSAPFLIAQESFILLPRCSSRRLPS